MREATSSTGADGHGALSTTHALLGATLLITPQLVLRWCGDPPGEAIRTGARLLAVRHLVEAALLWRYDYGDRRWFRAVDLSHAATMMGLAARGPAAYRRAALVSLAISGALGLLE